MKRTVATHTLRALLTLALFVAAGAALPALSLAAEPGPYVFSTVPDAGAEATLQTVRVGINPNGRGVPFTIVVEDPDGIDSVTTSRSLKITAPGQPTATLTPILTYASGTNETRAVLTATHTGLSLPETEYTATLTVTDKSGAVTVYTWTYFAYYFAPHVDSHTPGRDKIAASPLAPITANISGPRSAIVAATMRVDGAIVPATLTSVSNTVNTLTWTPSAPLADGVHTVQIDATNASGLSGTYTWQFMTAPQQPAFTLLAPELGTSLVPRADGTVGLEAICQDLDGVDPGSVTLSVHPPSGAPYDVDANVMVRIASARTTCDVSADVPLAGGVGAYTITATATDLLGNSASTVWVFDLAARAPVIDTFVPAEVSTTKQTRVSARVVDFTAGIDPASLQLYLDGSPIAHQVEPVSGGFIVYADVALGDNTSHSVGVHGANYAALSTSAVWWFDVQAAPVASGHSPAPGSTYRAEDVPVRIRFTEPDDGVNPDSLEVYFDGIRIADEDITRTLTAGGTVLDVLAMVHNVGGTGSTEHEVRVVLADTRGYAATETWRFHVIPQTAQVDMLIDTNQPCLSSGCHPVGTADARDWNSLHWVVGDAKGWGVPSTRASHKYNCNVCHFSKRDPTTGVWEPLPMHIGPLDPCKMCHATPGGQAVPVGVHGMSEESYPYRFLDHDDAEKYTMNAPAPGRDCLYCHQGAIGTQEIDNFANGTRTRAHDIVGDHRVGYPDDTCQVCHSAVLTREHAYDRDGDGVTIHCDDCHASERPEVAAAIRSYPALRYRFWGTDLAAYNTFPVPVPPSGQPPYSVETVGSYEIAGERIIGGRVRLFTSTLGILAVEGYSGGQWSVVYAKMLGGTTGDGSPGGKSIAKPFPVYPESVAEFSCDPVERVRVTYTPIAAGWHYVSANVDTWKLENEYVSTCDDCHGPRDPGHGFGVAQHTAEVGDVLDGSGFVCADCHGMELVGEHTRASSSSSANPLVCDTCHPMPRESFATWGKTCEQSGCHASGSPQGRHGDEGSVHQATNASSACFGSGCHGTGDLLALHLTAEEAGRTYCLVCHSTTAFPASRECSACHADKLDGEGLVVPHGEADPQTHTATGIEAQTLSGTWPSPGDNLTRNPAYVYNPLCTECHAVLLNTEHDKPRSSSAGQDCSTCHPTPRDTLDPWDKTCTQGGCHTLESAAPMHQDISARHATNPEHVTAGCGYRNLNGRYACHYHDVIQEHNRSLNTFDGIEVRDVSCAVCHNSTRFASLEGPWSGSCTECHPENHAIEGSVRYEEIHTLHDNPGGDYDNGVGNAGSNAMDAHGPNRPLTFSTSSGCAATTCHTNAFASGGYPNNPIPLCAGCHGPNILPVAPFAGTYMWDSGDTENINTSLRLSPITLPAGAYLDFWTYYDIEYGYDYGYVQVSTNGGSTWTPLPGSITVGASNMVTGSSGGWVPAHFDLSAYAGQTVALRFLYRTDYMVSGRGWLLDEIVIGGNAGQVFYDGAETLLPEWTVQVHGGTVAWKRSQ